MSFVTKHTKVLGKFESIWSRNINTIGREFDKQTVDERKYLVTKLEPYDYKIKTDFLPRNYRFLANKKRLSLHFFGRNSNQLFF